VLEDSKTDQTTTERMDSIKAIREEFEQVLDETKRMVCAEQLQLDKIKRTQRTNSVAFKGMQEAHQTELRRLDGERGRSTLTGDIAWELHARVQEMRYEHKLLKEQFSTLNDRSAVQASPMVVEIDAETKTGAIPLRSPSLPLVEDLQAATICPARAQVAVRVAPGTIKVVIIPRRSQKISAALATHAATKPAEATHPSSKEGGVGFGKDANGTIPGVLSASELVRYEGYSEALANSLVQQVIRMVSNGAAVALGSSAVIAVQFQTQQPRLLLIRRYFTALQWLQRWLA